jgi:dihydrofolate reductase
VPRIALIVAAASNGVIGRDGALPWHLPEDLRRFKALTLGKPIVMGRRTFESIGRALPGRRNLVVSAAAVSERLWPEGIEVVSNLRAAIERCADADEIVVIGGAGLYREALPLANRIYLTEVLADVEGDVCLPPIERNEWRELERVTRGADERHAYAMNFLILERKESSDVAPRAAF